MTETITKTKAFASQGDMEEKTISFTQVVGALRLYRRG